MRHAQPDQPEARPEGAPWKYAEAWPYLNISERTLHRLINAGKVQVIYIGKKPLIPDSEVRRLAAAGC